MNSTCPRCNTLIEPNTTFCTNCGAVLAPQNPYQQQGTPSAPQNPYQQSQQVSGGQIDSSAGGSLGFGGQGDATAKKILSIGVAIIAITIVLLLFFGMLALLIPGLRCL